VKQSLLLMVLVSYQMKYIQQISGPQQHQSFNLVAPQQVFQSSDKNIPVSTILLDVKQSGQLQTGKPLEQTMLTLS
jgi:hypothetical protein